MDVNDHLDVNVNDNSNSTSTKPDGVVSDSSETDIDDTSCSSGQSGDDSENDDTESGNQIVVDVLGGEDVEHEHYLNDGVKPDWMS